MLAAGVRGDPVAHQVLKYVINGWPEFGKKPPCHLAKFYNVRESLDSDGSCLYYGNRVFVPSSLRKEVLAKTISTQV